MSSRQRLGRGVLSAIVAAGLLAGCRGKPKAAPPVAAAPVVVAAAEPLSAPQVSDPLPPPQPIPPEAIPAEHAPPVAEPPRPQPPATPPRSRAPTPAQVAPPAGPTAPPSTAPGRTGSPGSSQLRPFLTPPEEKELQRRIDQSLASADKFLARVGSRAGSKEATQRVKALMDQARQARRRGDLNMSRSLAERAEILASDLARSGK